MGRTIKGLCLSGLLLSAAASSAQPYLINRNPVRNADDAFRNMFGLPEQDTAFFFRANFPGDNFLTIQFNKLSYWQEGGLREIIDVARLAQEQVRDSLSGTATAQRISLSVPPANYPVVAALRETGKDQRVLMLGRSGASPLRIAHDTITVRRGLPGNPLDSSEQRAVLYTFLLKDLSEIETIGNDTALIGNTSRKFDSLVARRRVTWKNQDAPVHSFSAEYELRDNAVAPGLRTLNSFLLLKRFDLFAEFGVSVLTTNIGLAGNAKIAYTWREGNAPANLFTALSFSGIAFAKRVDDRIERQYQNFVNLEYGFAFAKGRGGFPIYRTSVGFGYQIQRHNIDIDDYQYRVFISYSVSRAITLVTDGYFLRRNERTGQERLGIGGLTVLMRFL